MTNEQLVLRIQANDNKKESLAELYRQNYGLLVKIVSRYNRDFDDLMQEAFIGLCNACEHWSADEGASFITYAHYWILQAVHRYVMENNSVKIPEYQVSLIHKYRKILRDYALKSSKKPSDRYLMLNLGITLEQLKQLKKDAVSVEAVSLDTPISEDGYITLCDTVEAKENHIENLEDKIQYEQLYKTIWPLVDNLEQIQSDTIHARYQDNKTIKEVSQELGIPESKVVSAEQKALRELRRPKNRKILRPFLPDDTLYSLSLRGGYGSFKNTWTSSPERVILMYEEHKLKEV